MVLLYIVITVRMCFFTMNYNCEVFQGLINGGDLINRYIDGPDEEFKSFLNSN